MRITKSLQGKLEEIFFSLDFKVRYEKGNFAGGYCLLEKQNVVVVNKFFPLESKVNTLIEVLKQIEIDESKLVAAQLRLLAQFKQTELQF